MRKSDTLETFRTDMESILTNTCDDLQRFINLANHNSAVTPSTSSSTGSQRRHSRHPPATPGEGPYKKGSRSGQYHVRRVSEPEKASVLLGCSVAGLNKDLTTAMSSSNSDVVAACRSARSCSASAASTMSIQQLRLIAAENKQCGKIETMPAKLYSTRLSDSPIMGGGTEYWAKLTHQNNVTNVKTASSRTRTWSDANNNTYSSVKDVLHCATRGSSDSRQHEATDSLTKTACRSAHRPNKSLTSSTSGDHDNNRDSGVAVDGHLGDALSFNEPPYHCDGKTCSSSRGGSWGTAGPDGYTYCDCTCHLCTEQSPVIIQPPASSRRVAFLLKQLRESADGESDAAVSAEQCHRDDNNNAISETTPGDVIVGSRSKDLDEMMSLISQSEDILNNNGPSISSEPAKFITPIATEHHRSPPDGRTLPTEVHLDTTIANNRSCDEAIHPFSPLSGPGSSHSSSARSSDSDRETGCDRKMQRPPKSTKSQSSDSACGERQNGGYHSSSENVSSPLSTSSDGISDSSSREKHYLASGENGLSTSESRDTERTLNVASRLHCDDETSCEHGVPDVDENSEASEKGVVDLASFESPEAVLVYLKQEMEKIRSKDLHIFSQLRDLQRQIEDYRNDLLCTSDEYETDDSSESIDDLDSKLPPIPQCFQPS